MWIMRSAFEELVRREEAVQLRQEAVVEEDLRIFGDRQQTFVWMRSQSP
jgi:hypothetical protein